MFDRHLQVHAQLHQVADLGAGITPLRKFVLVQGTYTPQAVHHARAIQVLAADVAREEGDMLASSDAAYPIWSPYDAFEGAATLMRLLDEEQAA